MLNYMGELEMREFDMEMHGFPMRHWINDLFIGDFVGPAFSG